MAEEFRFAFAPSYRAAGLPFGISPDNALVTVGYGHLDARFGPWRLRTRLSNVVGTEITGPYLFIKTAGPARLGVTDLGLTFATNGDRGVRIDFRRSVPGIAPLSLL